MTEQEIDQVYDTGTTPRLTIRNVGGISAATVTLGPGITLVAGRNATNKSSLLRSLAGVLGGPVPPVKSDTDTGSVEMTLGSETYHLELARDGRETRVTSAKPYSEAADRCELFVTLTETNPIRQAVLAGDDLYDLLMRPVDTDEIAAEIRRLQAEKDRLDDRLDELDAMEARRSELRERRTTLEADLDEVETVLDRKRETVADIETDLGGQSDGTEESDERRAERTQIRNRLETTADAITSLEAELETVTAELEEIGPDDTDTTVAELEADLETLHQRKQELTSTVNALAPLVELNTRLLDDGQRVPEALQSDDITADLDPSTRTVSCWTCGSSVERSQIETQVETVRELLQDKRNQRDTVTERIQLLTERKRELERQRTEREELRDRRAELRQELAERRETRSELETELAELEQEIEASRTDDPASGREAKLSEYYDEITDLEYERGRLTTDLDDVEAELDDIERALSERPTVEPRRETVAAELTDQRERIVRLERDLVDRFNEEMQAVLDTLGYGAVERIWLERRGGDTDEVTADATFDLHVVRSTDEGAAYDDTVENLSKSEREVIGLVVGLAGYLAHDVGEEIPFIVVDAVEMFDAERIRGLVEQFSDHAEYVVATVLPEEHERLNGAYDSISTATLDN
ncbi:archaea-specific SMC-related protein [Haloarcula halophila]|uniref:archaea-specific SMC-related protein n=1 Tax=Haloarcula TaxID=2237 RepID=UPI0023E4247D|nr:archaea-specific SMC-related protein [Halomicroarcula sp. DFY41]